MAAVRWAWDDSIVARGRWSGTATVTDVVSQLRRLDAGSRGRRSVRLAINGSEIPFCSADEAAAFLQAQAECQVLSAGGKVITADVRRAMLCTSGHEIQWSTRAAARWFSSSFRCDACGVQRRAPCTEWRCARGCDYHVCDSCYRHAAHVAAALGRTLKDECSQAIAIKAESVTHSSIDVAAGDDSPHTCTEAALNQWEASWWGEISTKDSASDADCASEPPLSPVPPPPPPCKSAEASALAIDVAYDLVERHLATLTTTVAPEHLQGCLSRLLRAAKALPDDAGAEATEASMRSSSSTTASADSLSEVAPSEVEAPSAVPQVDRTNLVDMSEDDVREQRRRPSEEYLLRIQLEKLAKDNESLREQIKGLYPSQVQLAKMKHECEVLQQNNNDLARALAEVSAGRNTIASDHATADITSALDLSENQKASAHLASSSSDIPPCTGEECPLDASVVSTDSPGSLKAKGKGKGKASVEEPTVEGAGPVENKGKGATGPPVKGKGKATSSPPVKGKGKGKGKTTPEPSKPSIQLQCDVKSLPWKRWQLAVELTPGETIWDSVGKLYASESLSTQVPVDELATRFAKTAGLQAVDKEEQEVVRKPKFAKLQSIPESDRLQRELALKTLPPHLDSAQKALIAIRSLDGQLLSGDSARILYRSLCPTEEQEHEIRALRQAGEDDYAQQLETWREAGAVEGKQPNQFQWDRIETFLEGLSALPAVEARLSCWIFLSTLPERMDHLNKGIQEFDAVVRCFQESRELPYILGLALAFGNTLNGGKNERRLGQADGFHVEALGRPGGFDVVNDAKGKNIRQLIFETYFTKTPERAEKLLQELTPLFQLVQRRFGKADGAPTFDKDVRVEIEDFEKSLEQLRTEFDKRQRELQSALSRIGPDSQDPFVLEMPCAFERARESLAELVEQKDDVRRRFNELLGLFRAETFRGDPQVVGGKLQDGNPKEEMTSRVWCRLWDDFFISGNLVLQNPERVQKEIFAPRFCGSEPITVESLEMLWQLRKPISLADVAAKRRRSQRRRTEGDLATGVP